MIEVVLRSHNDMPVIEETLAGLEKQTVPFRLIGLDNASSDGTLEAVSEMADEVIHIPAGKYIPGRVLNIGMRATHGDTVVFLNSDCTPQHDTWLEELLAGMEVPHVAAVFGRQIPREDCVAPYIKDTEECYGDGEIQKSFLHMFSMASSAIQRDVWKQMPFSEELQYSEDIDWTWRARQRGYQIRYMKDSIVAHSHNYTLKQLFKRQFGEGCAEAQIFDMPASRRNFVRYTLLPYGMQVLRDWKTFARMGAWKHFIAAPVHRGVQHWGRRKGFNEGWREKIMEEKKCA